MKQVGLGRRDFVSKEYVPVRQTSADIRSGRRRRHGGITRKPKSGGYCPAPKRKPPKARRGTQGGFGGGVGNKTNKRGSGFSSRKSKKSGTKGSSSSSKGS